MTDQLRPRGRRSLLRGIGLALLVLAAPGVASGAAQGAEGPTAPQISEIEGPRYVGPLASGPDGAVWALPGSEYEGYTLERFGAGGRLSSHRLPNAYRHVRSALTPLADGGMAAIVTERGDRSAPRVALLRAVGDAAPRFIPLPREAGSAVGFAIAADGTVWFGRLCEDELFSWRPGSAPARHPLNEFGCPPGYNELGSSLAIGPDGAVWLANTWQERIVRRDVSGRVRQWDVSAGAGPMTLVTDPRSGALAYVDLEGANGGLITSAGQLRSFERGGQTVFASGGALLRATNAGLERIAADGSTSTSALPPAMESFAIAMTRAGEPWLLAARNTTAPSSEETIGDPIVATPGEGGLATWALPSPPRITPWLQPRLTLDGSGALWTALSEAYGGAAKLVRIVPHTNPAATRATASFTRLLARDGRSTTVQVSCAASRGRYCRGTVRLASAAAAVRYIAPGQSSAAIRLTLGDRAARALRRRGVVRTRAIVTSVGAGTTSRALTLRR